MAFTNKDGKSVSYECSELIEELKMDWKNYEKYDGKNITVNNEYTGKCELETEGLNVYCSNKEVYHFEYNEVQSIKEI